jgi:hypothetical protein
MHFRPPNDAGPVRSSGKRAALTIQQVQEIFDLRVPAAEMPGSLKLPTFTSRSEEISRMYGVSPKAVRDIWNRRTWCGVTSAIYPETETVQHGGFTAVRGAADFLFAVQRSKGGRPRGSKDSKPRKRRIPQQLNGSYPPDERDGLGLTNRHDVVYALQVNQPSGYHNAQSSTASFRKSVATSKKEQHDFPWPDGDDGLVREDEEQSLCRTYPFFLQF